ncbi:MAG: universal stress protein [Ramlibacter sp.]|jgi:nucleotide-binding universal stress UspA family protein|nr:universal stress protein [Ramlibacter sp.]
MYRRILVALDGSETSIRALTASLNLARQGGGRVRMVHVVEELAYLGGFDPYGASSGDLIKVIRENAEKVLANGLAAAQSAGVEADTVLYDNFGERLPEAVADAAKQWNADLIVVGTHGRRGIGRVLMGSGAEQIIRVSPVPVLVIRSPEAPPA